MKPLDVCVAGVLTLMLCSSAVAQPASPGIPALNLTITRATRLLVIAPHPDDDVLAAGGLIRRILRLGGRVHVVWMTSGDGFPEGVETAEGIGRSVAHLTPRDFQTYGSLREQEAREALASLGAGADSLTFLGFPDEGLCELASSYLSAGVQAFKSPYTGRINPPPTEQVIRGVAYVGADVRRELARVVVSFAPTVIVAPHAQDEHPDHCSTHILLRETLEDLVKAGRPAPRVLHYLVHYGQWPLAGVNENTRMLAPPEHFPAAQGRWVSFALSADELGAKRVALLFYRSQMLVMGRLLAAFARDNELFLEGEPTSPPRCWCDGQNVNVAPLPARERSQPPPR